MTQNTAKRQTAQAGNPLPSPALDHFPGLTPACRRVYAALISHCRPGKLYCWPSLLTIAEAAGCTVRTVSRALDTLEEHGLLTRLSVYAHGRRQGTVYRLKDLSPLLPFLSPPRWTPRSYVPGEKLSTVEMSTKPLPPKDPNPVAGYPIPLQPDPKRQGVKLPSRPSSSAQDRRSPWQTGLDTPRQTGRPRRIEARPRSKEEAALWCLALDRGFSDRPGNRRRLALVVARHGLEALRRLVEMAQAKHVHSPGAYLQVLLSRRLAATG